MSNDAVKPAVLSLAFAVILFGAILTGYALLRFNDPGAFTGAPKLLDRRIGLVTAALLVTTCLAALAALRSALAAKTRPAHGWLGVALLAGAAVLVVLLIELPSTSRSAGFLPKRTGDVATASPKARAVSTTHVGDAANGKKIFLGTCAACHAPDGSGVKGQGQNLRDSTFLKDKTDEQALAFVKTGRQPFDPDSKLHLSMPARGGNPALSDASLLDAIVYVRELEKQAATVVRGAAASVASPAARTTSPDQPQVIDGQLWLPHSILPAAQRGPTGPARGAEGHTVSNVRRFFTLLLFVNGLHAIYLLFGQALGLALLVSAMRGGAPRPFVALASVYWVVISAIGLVLLPAFYF